MAVAASSVALTPTAGHIALPGPRVVSDVNIRLASCGAGPYGLATYCTSGEAYGYDDTGYQSTTTIYGPLGGTSTLYYNYVYNETSGDATVTVDFTGPLGRTIGGSITYKAYDDAQHSRRSPVRPRSAVTRGGAAVVAPRSAAANSVTDAKSDEAATIPRSAAARAHATASPASATNRRASHTTA